MKDTKLIIICGMSGCGKSSISQNIAWQYKRNGIPNEWYHEEMENHPIRWANGGEFTVGDLQTEEGMTANIKDFYGRWENLIADMTRKGGVYILEGCLFQVIVRNFIPAAFPEDKIRTFYKRLFDILAPANPRIIHLYRHDVSKSFQKAFKTRGKQWENIITGSEENFEFADETNYQNLARSIFACCTCEKLGIDTSDEDWSVYQREICSFLGICYYDRIFPPLHKPERYTGVFEFCDGNVTEAAKVIYEDGNLFCSPAWFTHIEMNYIGEDRFELLGFPMVFRYDFTGDVPTVTVTGNYDWGIVGKTLKLKHI